MAGKSNSTARKTAKSSAPQARTSPIRMVVRRGALKRFEDLKKKTAHLQVEVVWDQRDDVDRRQEPCLSDSERRAKERRRTPPFTWDVADFVVVTPPDATKKLRKRKTR